MNNHMKLSEILMDELPEEHPWKGNVKGLVERLIANGVTFAKDTDVLTNGDRIWAMSDEELVRLIFEYNIDEYISFCEERPECVEAMETLALNPDSDACKACLLKWLRKPMEA